MRLSYDESGAGLLFLRQRILRTAFDIEKSQGVCGGCAR
jgi:hypothetical protein